MDQTRHIATGTTPVRVAIAGSSGSIGTQTLDVIRAEGPERYRIVALGAGTSAELLVEQACEFKPQVVAVTNDAARSEVRAALASAELGNEIEVVADLADVVEVADVVINGVVGFAGLKVTTETLRAGKRLGLANKESLIAAGPVVQPLRLTPNAEIVPVDSEHCAIHQCLRSSIGFQSDGSENYEVARLVLTASGGPFRGKTMAELAAVTIEDALAHPTWSMGPKITIDSSTLINKGLEVIEAQELFGIDVDRIDVVVHPQSVVHSMVDFTDGSTIAQMSMPDMRLPIGYALGYPHRIRSPFGQLDWTQLAELTFEQPDRDTFRGLDLAYQAGRTGGGAPAWLSAANEVAVDAFLGGRIAWNQIVDVSVATLDEYDGAMPATVEDVIAADGEARRRAGAAVERL